jgi:hypothetical protein
MVNPFVPHALLRDPTQGQLVQRVLQGAIPDQVYTDPGDGREKMVEFKWLSTSAPRGTSSGGDKSTCLAV